MIKGYIVFYWPEDLHRQKVSFMHQLKGIQYKGKRPTNYLVVITESDVYNVDIPLLNEWLRTVPQVIKRIF